ncbi:SusC/RagA family TonB-linked outer membrane protein [Pedobacter lusitanus]
MDENAVLLVSFMGYKTKEVRVGTQNSLTVVLEVDMASLSDVVVVGYGTTKRKDLVGSVTSVGGNDLRKQEATNFTQALAGRAAGVQVSRPGGEPGAGASIRIRGMSTVMGVNDPLYVIDGIPVQLYNGGGVDAIRSAPGNGLMDPLAGIDVNDIENIEILKDATATAIYGSRGANGVIVVTTKRGKAGADPVFNFSYDVSVDQQRKFYDVLSGPDYAKFMQDTYAKNKTPIDDVSFPGKGNTDWQRAITQTGLVQNLNLSLLGASKDGATTYAFSSGLTDQKGILINSGFKRYSVRTNIETRVFSLLKVGTNLNFSSSTQTGGISPIYTTYGVASYRPDIPIYNPDGSYANDGSSDNPVASRQGKSSNESRRLLASVFAELEIIKGLKLRSTLSYDINNNKGYTYSPSWLFSEKLSKGSRTDKAFDYVNRVFDNTLSYSRSFDKHQIDIVGGASWTLNKSNFNSTNSSNFPNDNVLNNLGSAGTITGFDSGAESSGLESFFLRANYNYDGKYYLNLTGRADNSTKFGPESQWGYFPSVGASWRFSKEDFMKKLSFIDDAKLRVTVGKTGTSAFGSFGFLTLFNTGYFYNGVNGLRANPDAGEPNPDIHWESTMQTDAALELSFLQSRLKTTVNYYRKYTKGLISSPSIPASGGYTFQTKNLGDISNQGWEITLSAIPVIKGSFTWLSDFNITFNKNKVEKTYGTTLYGTLPLIEGLP